MSGIPPVRAQGTPVRPDENSNFDKLVEQLKQPATNAKAKKALKDQFGIDIDRMKIARYGRQLGDTTKEYPISLSVARVGKDVPLDINVALPSDAEKANLLFTAHRMLFPRTSQGHIMEPRNVRGAIVDLREKKTEKVTSHSQPGFFGAIKNIFSKATKPEEIQNLIAPRLDSLAEGIAIFPPREQQTEVFQPAFEGLKGNAIFHPPQSQPLVLDAHHRGRGPLPEAWTNLPPKALELIKMLSQASTRQLSDNEFGQLLDAMKECQKIGIGFDFYALSDKADNDVNHDKIEQLKNYLTDFTNYCNLPKEAYELPLALNYLKKQQKIKNAETDFNKLSQLQQQLEAPKADKKQLLEQVKRLATPYEELEKEVQEIKDKFSQFADLQNNPYAQRLGGEIKNAEMDPYVKEIDDLKNQILADHS